MLMVAPSSANAMEAGSLPAVSDQSLSATTPSYNNPSATQVGQNKPDPNIGKPQTHSKDCEPDSQSGDGNTNGNNDGNGGGNVIATADRPRCAVHGGLLTPASQAHHSVIPYVLLLLAAGITIDLIRRHFKADSQASPHHSDR
ncbi:hypothetical protein [Bifidobacterium sp. ESL0800]|uniref:hypothetical protein n=1 Tax=Bifidobacterium sp. ESL0800 TaxID=2983236 RepID=UPI0023F80180|nr:hypothetical protein [Bifidobacterium sp. ESL0800]WEV75280.1 hypothetical protein OZX75_06495 [Bifidobacterium sp. ESL0800]